MTTKPKRKPRGVVARSFTGDLRIKLEKALGFQQCPTCRHVEPQSIRANARRVGIHYATFFRFMTGKPPSADTVDAVVEFLDRTEKGVKR